MKLLLFLLLLTSIGAAAQKQKVSYYLFKKNWEPAKDISTADYVLQSTYIGDSLHVNRLFRGSGVLWKQESFKDEEETIPHGHFAWYDEQGRIDSTGFVNNKRKDRNWAYYNDTMGIYLALKYDNGKVVERKDYIKKIIITAEGEKTFAEAEKEKEITPKYPDEKEAQFKGGVQGFRKYLEKNIVPPTNLIQTGLVKIQFMINKSGKVQDLLVLKSLQLSADVEALRVLSEMPDWTPAYQNGKNVYYQAIQHLTFQVSR